MPLSPPVTATHCVATDHRICARASVSIAAYTPCARRTNQPAASAATAATSGPTSRLATNGSAANFIASAAP